MKTYRPYAPTQTYLMPPSPTDWLPADHLAYFILDLVEELDLSEIDDALQGKDPRGERPFPPRMMVALLLYGYCTGVFSSRRMARATFEDVAFRVLAAGEHPHFTTINGFRARHRAALARLFVQVLRQCQKCGLVKLGHVALDGTKMKANASKHKAMSYDRMKRDEEKLKAEIEALLAKADATDAEEDGELGEGQDRVDIPSELQRRENRKAMIRAARAELEREAAEARAAELRAQAEALRAKAADPATPAQLAKTFATVAEQRDDAARKLNDDDRDPPATGGGELPRHQTPSTKNGQPTPKAQRNFTDPDSRIMFRDGAVLQGYNAQIAVDEHAQVIVAAGLSNQPADTNYYAPMLDQVVDNCGAVPERTTADAGYFSAANVRFAEQMGTEPFTSVGKHRNNGNPEPLPPHYNTPARTSMRTLLASRRGHAIYARRKATVEPVFGQIRSCRGFRQMSFRGLIKNRCEWLFVCLTHNVLKLFRAKVGLLPAAA